MSNCKCVLLREQLGSMDEASALRQRGEHMYTNNGHGSVGVTQYMCRELSLTCVYVWCPRRGTTRASSGRKHRYTHQSLQRSFRKSRLFQYSSSPPIFAHNNFLPNWPIHSPLWSIHLPNQTGILPHNTFIFPLQAQQFLTQIPYRIDY